MKSFYQKVKISNFDVIYNIYSHCISNNIIEIIFTLIEVTQCLSFTLSDGVKFLFIYIFLV